MPDPILDELNLITLKEMYPRMVEDNFFLNAPFLAYLRANSMVPFNGGAFSQETFLYNRLKGGAYAKGDSFDISYTPIMSGMLFDMKYYEISVPVFKEDIQVLNVGPQKVFSLIDVLLRSAINSINEDLALALSLHGQPSSATIVGNRPKHINGWIEAVNDGVSQGWDGSIFASYGTQARNGVIGDALNSRPYFCGTAAGAAGPLTYAILEETYQTASIGRVEPDLGVCNKAVYAFIKEKIMPQQRFSQELDPVWGVPSFRINNAMILKDDYFPSAIYGKTRNGQSSTTGTFTAAAGNNWEGTNMTSGTATVGEVFAWLNTKKWAMRISTDPEHAFGFSGFVPAQDNTRVVGQVKFAGNLECISPRHQKQIFGINS